jgi:hypothetical protein
MNLPCPEEVQFRRGQMASVETTVRTIPYRVLILRKTRNAPGIDAALLHGRRRRICVCEFQAVCRRCAGIAYDTVLKRFDEHFIIAKNVIFERAQFNQRKQEPCESPEAFVIVLHKLADACDLGALRDELFRDRIVVGIQGAKISEQLLLDREMTLAKAVAVVRFHPGVGDP